jgi:glycine/D-amino acid oxidase-like deaminating enzyme
VWESARPYLYLRTTADNRVIAGGEDIDLVNPQERDRLVPSKAKRLCERFAEVFPAISVRHSCAWGGTFAQTRDGLPYIDTLPEFPHSYLALGYGGNGITFSLLAAQIIVASFLGKEAKDAHLFRFDR